MKIKLVDAIGIGLLIIGILFTIVNFVAARGPSVEVRDLQLHEIPNAPPPQGKFDKIKFVLSAQGPEAIVPTPYRMGDWTECRDGSRSYARNLQNPPQPPIEIPCTAHGGVRAYAPGKRLNEP